ncbi:hypothetical protein BKA93DRAFT_612971 [Sparassis latifolia]
MSSRPWLPLLTLFIHPAPPPELLLYSLSTRVGHLCPFFPFLTSCTFGLPHRVRARGIAPTLVRVHASVRCDGNILFFYPAGQAGVSRDVGAAIDCRDAPHRVLSVRWRGEGRRWAVQPASYTPNPPQCLTPKVRHDPGELPPTIYWTVRTDASTLSQLDITEGLRL